MEPNIAEVFQSSRNTNMDKEEKSTIDKVFEDLDDDSETVNEVEAARTQLENGTNFKTNNFIPINANNNTQMIDLGNKHSNESILNANKTQMMESNEPNLVTNGTVNGMENKGIIDISAQLNVINTISNEPIHAITEGSRNPINVHNTTNLMEHIEVGHKSESMKTKDGIDLADLLEDLCNDSQSNSTAKVDISNVPNNLLDDVSSLAISNKHVGPKICKTDALAKVEAPLEIIDSNNYTNINMLETDRPKSDTNFGLISRTKSEVDGSKSDSKGLTSGRKISSQLSASFNLHDPNPSSDQPHEFPGDFGFDSHSGLLVNSFPSTSREHEELNTFPSTSKGQEEMSFNKITLTSKERESFSQFDEINFDSSTQVGTLSERTPKENLPFSSTSERQDCTSQYNEGIFDSNTHLENPSDRSPKRDFFQLHDQVSQRSPKKELSHLHSLESDGHMFHGRQYISYDDGLSEPSNHYHKNIDSLTDPHLYHQTLDYSSGDFSNASGLHESDLLSKYKQMEAQQELLNHSLISLSTHFAQVQLRLKQIINSPKNEQETLLKNLEKFTFIGIPEVNELCLYNYETKSHDDDSTETAECKSYIEDKLAFEKNKHKEMIGKLKIQLESLENYVYEFSNNDDAEIPTSLIINKQQIIINELKDKLNLNVNLSEEGQLREEINKSIIGPMKTKEDLILQLKTQISDLEKFINFLQSTQCKCTVEADSVDMKQKTITIMKKISTILHIFAEHHSSNFKKPTTVASMKKSMKVNHYGDLRAQLEIAINHVIDACRQPPDQDIPIDSDYMSDTEDPIPCNSKVALAVRKHLAPTLQRLLQHGLSSPNTNQTVSVVQYISCASSVNKRQSTAHIWDLINKYYEIKEGPDFNCKPNRKLSESFNLEIGAGTLGIKQSLLASIGNILAVHHKYKKFNPDSYFKSFVCDGLNKKLLVEWLNLILTYKSFSQEYYASWSYVSSTRFVDAAASLRRLNEFHFSLTIVDVAIRNLQSIKDAF
ncbi:hypothetical protein WDU94_000396 [Cyamophila willieti]